MGKGKEGEPSEEDRGITPQETRALSDAKLKEGGARLEVTKAQVEEARHEMEYEKNPAVGEFRKALESFKKTQEANTERHLTALKAEIGNPGEKNFDDAYDFAGTAIDSLDKTELEELNKLRIEAGIPNDEKGALPFMADDVRQFNKEREKHRQLKIELDEIVKAHEKIVKLKAEV